MNEKLIALAERRQRLIQKIALQRKALAQSMEPLRQPLIVVDHGIEFIRYFRRYPVLMAGVSAITGILIRKFHIARISALVQTGWSVFQLVRDVRESIRKS